MKNGRRLSAARVLALVASVASLALIPLGASNAATPGAGTVSASNPAVSWTGPFKVPTGSANCGGPDNAACDNFRLTIEPPSGAFSVEIKLQPFAAGDWDLQVWSPDGALAGSSGSNPGQLESVTLVNPAAGTYTVSGAPFAPAPGLSSYTASATIVALGGSTQPPNGTEHVTYANHAAPAPLGQGAGEPTLGANWDTGTVMYQAGLEALKVTFDDSTSPARAAWRDVSFPTTAAASADPIGFLDHETGRWFTSQLSGTTSLMAFTDDDGASWTPSEGGPMNGGVDHQSVGGGPYHAPMTGTIYENAVYYCSQDIVAALCARSDTGGATFNPATPIYTSECGGLHGHVKVGPDGTVYVPNKSCGGHQGVVVSEDNGGSWSVRPVPQSGQGEWDPSVAIASDGTVYLAYGDADGHAKVAVSHDDGRSWTNVRDVGLPFGVAHTAFPVAAAGDPDRAAIAFLGSTYAGPGAFGDDPKWPGEWHVYVAHTYDGGATWTTVNATPGDPVQRGTICGGGFNGCPNGTRNLLDFQDADVDKQGRFLVAYPDGCVGSCIAGGSGSFTSVAAIARQMSGRRLFAQHDQVGVPAAPVASAKASAGPPPANVISWQEPEDHGSRITGYKVYRRTAGTGSAVVATVGGEARSYVDTQISSGETYYYKVSAANAQGEGAASPEVTPEAAPVPEDPCVEPGIKVLTDPSGDALDSKPDHDVQWAAVAEPRELGAGKIEFLLKMASLASPSANTSWPVVFKTPDGTDRWVAMKTNVLGSVAFQHGTGTNASATGAAADPSSSYSADGVIRIVLARNALGGLEPGQKLTDFQTRIRVEVPGGSALTPDNMPDSLARTGSYTVKGNESCAQPQPDLTLAADDVGFVQEDGKTSKLVTILATVHNAGTADATDVKIRFTVDGQQVGAVQTIQRVGAGSFARASVVWDTRGQNGDHTVGVTADPANTVAESKEDNNSASRVVNVKGKKIG